MKPLLLQSHTSSSSHFTPVAPPTLNARPAAPPCTSPLTGYVCTRRYFGEVEGVAVGAWVGVALDEPQGRHDGSKGGRRYFEAAAGCGIFVRPHQVTLLKQGEPDMEGLGPDDEI